MATQTGVNPLRATLTIWGVVNEVNLLQAAGFRSRLRSRSLAVNHLLGYVIIALTIPAGVALVAFWRQGSDWRQWIGGLGFIAFIVLMICVDYLWPVEFRSPVHVSILAPYLALFFGAILLMGIPMFRLNRGLWLVTVATTVLLLISMGLAMRKGVG